MGHIETGLFGTELSPTSFAGISVKWPEDHAPKTEQAKAGIGDGKDSASARAERTDHQFPIAGVDEQHLWNLRMGKVKASQRDHGFGRVGGRVQ